MFIRYIYVYKQIKINGKLFLVLIFLIKKFIVASFLLQDVRCRTEACWRMEQTLCNLIFDCSWAVSYLNSASHLVSSVSPPAHVCCLPLPVKQSMNEDISRY
jgi:hypothetical protein